MRLKGTLTGFDAGVPVGLGGLGGLDQFIRLMADPMAVIDPNGHVIAVNDAFLDLLGCTEDGLLGKPLSLFNEDGLNAFPSSFEVKSGDIDLVFRAKDGRRLGVISSVSPVYGKEGPGAFLLLVKGPGKKYEDRLIEGPGSAKEDLARRIDYLEDFRTGVFQMVKELESSEQELESAYRLLQETSDQLVQSSKMTALGELASALAHELSQPVTIIKGLSQSMIESSEEGSPAREKLRLIIHAVNRMDAFIKHLRLFSRKDRPVMEPVDLKRVINEAFVMVKGLLSSHSIDVRMDLGPLPLILGSSVRLEQVIINIVTNARDAMPEGGVLEIKTRDENTGGRRYAALSISDNGAGIPDEDLKRVFDPFFTTKEPGKGTGLGLSISYRIVKEHKGEITVESAPGRGTTFRITIPAADIPENNRHARPG